MSADINSIDVAVRVRPFTAAEGLALDETENHERFFRTDASFTTGATSLLGRRSKATRQIISVLDERVLIFDPHSPIVEAQKKLLAPSFKKVKDMRYCFDRVYDMKASQSEVFEGSAKPLIDSVLSGINATIFAFGATGAGKSHTISGSVEDPGIVFLAAQELFQRIESVAEESIVDISVSYLEVYNEQIRDLLTDGPSNAFLDLREEKGRVHVANLSEHIPKNAHEVISLIQNGNSNRTTHPTDANAVSSRSHAVLSINVKRRERTANISEDFCVATLSIIDLAGSERASATNNRGVRLKEGSNINKSLLALGNCINALCRSRSGHIPYRDSKLTRLLRHSLGGNCKTVMITCVSPSSQQYDETQNSLRYANRAKEIKTKISKNIVSVDRHVSSYVKVIYELRAELEERRKTDGDRETKGRDSDRKERRAAIDQIAKAFDDLAAARQEATRRACLISYAQTSLEPLRDLEQMLVHWRRSALREVDLAEHDGQEAAEARQLYLNLIADLAKDIQSHDSQAGQTNNALTMLESSFINLERKTVHEDAKVELSHLAKQFRLQITAASAEACNKSVIEAWQWRFRAMQTVDSIWSSLSRDEALTESLASATHKLRQTMLGTDHHIGSIKTARPPVQRKPKASTPRKMPAKSPRKQHRSPLKSSLLSSPRKRAGQSVKKAVVWIDEAADSELEISQGSVVEHSREESATSSDIFKTPLLPIKQPCSIVKSSSIRMQAGFLSKRKEDAVVEPPVAQDNQSSKAASMQALSGKGPRRSSLGPMRNARRVSRTSYLDRTPKSIGKFSDSRQPKASVSNKENSFCSPTLSAASASPKKTLASSRLPSRLSMAPGRATTSPNLAGDSKTPVWR